MASATRHAQPAGIQLGVSAAAVAVGVERAAAALTVGRQYCLGSTALAVPIGGSSARIRDLAHAAHMTVIHIMLNRNAEAGQPHYTFQEPCPT